MRALRDLTATTALLLSTLALGAQKSATPSDADKAGIDATIDTFNTTLTAKDFDKFATVFTDDADFVNIVGMHWHGKAQIVKAHKVVFTTRYNGVPAQYLERSEAMLAPNIALVVTKIHMDNFTDRNGKPMKDNFFRMTLVMEKQGGKWLIRSAENTVIDMMAAPHDPGQ